MVVMKAGIPDDFGIRVAALRGRVERKHEPIVVVVTAAAALLRLVVDGAEALPLIGAAQCDER